MKHRLAAVIATAIHYNRDLDCDRDGIACEKR
jgi:excalibur calcium-binding domain-containing protein